MFHIRFLVLSTQCYSARRMNKEASSVANSMSVRYYSSARAHTHTHTHTRRHIFRQVSQFLHLCLLSHGQPRVRNHRLGVLFPNLGSSLYTCFSTAGPLPGTGPWLQLYLATRGFSGMCHFSFLCNFS